MTFQVGPNLEIIYFNSTYYIHIHQKPTLPGIVIGIGNAKMNQVGSNQFPEAIVRDFTSKGINTEWGRCYITCVKEPIVIYSVGLIV